jgi:hypothetical protein
MIGFNVSRSTFVLGVFAVGFGLSPNTNYGDEPKKPPILEAKGYFVAVHQIAVAVFCDHLFGVFRFATGVDRRSRTPCRSTSGIRGPA